MLELESAAGRSVFEEAQKWEGQVLANGNFRLRRYLGGSDHSAVFLTDIGVGQIRPPAIKLIAADPSGADIQLARWKAAAKLTHPNLLQIFDSGRCRWNNEELLFVVSENADETLAEILRERCLTPDEVREMLKPALETLSYLHDNGYSAGLVCPSNMMAIGEQVKLASDGVCRAGSPSLLTNQYGTDAIRGAGALAECQLPIVHRRLSPEAALEGLTPASDIWGLGMTIAEALTQRPPVWNDRLGGEPMLPESVPEPFSDIVRHCLARDPRRRCTIADIKSRLKQHTAVPVSEQPSELKVESRAIIAAKRGRQWLNGLGKNAVENGLNGLGKATNSARPVRRFRINKPTAAEVALPALRRVFPKYAYAIPIVAMLAAVLLFASMLWHRASPVNESTTGEPGSAQPVAAATPPTKPSVKKGTPALAENVVHRAVPTVPEKALRTIHGKVRVRVKVNVDSEGNVAGAEFASAGPSRYFADLALQAARGWKFTQGEGSRAWLLQFVFEDNGVVVAEREL